MLSAADAQVGSKLRTNTVPRANVEELADVLVGVPSPHERREWPVLQRRRRGADSREAFRAGLSTLDDGCHHLAEVRKGDEGF